MSLGPNKSKAWKTCTTESEFVTHNSSCFGSDDQNIVWCFTICLNLKIMNIIYDPIKQHQRHDNVELVHQLYIVSVSIHRKLFLIKYDNNYNFVSNMCLVIFMQLQLYHIRKSPKCFHNMWQKNIVCMKGPFEKERIRKLPNLIEVRSLESSDKQETSHYLNQRVTCFLTKYVWPGLSVTWCCSMCKSRLNFTWAKST